MVWMLLPVDRKHSLIKFISCCVCYSGLGVEFRSIVIAGVHCGGGYFDDLSECSLVLSYRC